MTVKCKYKDIKDIYEWCEKYADDMAKELLGKQLSIHEVAYYTPSQANWSYRLGVVKVDSRVYEVVEVFGAIKAVKLANLPEYSMGEIRAKREW